MPKISKIKIVLDKGAIMPDRAHETDAGLDLYSREYMKIAPNDIGVFDTGVHVEIPKNYVGLLTSKSSLMLKGITSRGTIDCGYSGTIKAVLFNHSTKHVVIQKGQKITQLVLMPIVTPVVEEVELLKNSDRGTDGFGSSGQF